MIDRSKSAPGYGDSETFPPGTVCPWHDDGQSIDEIIDDMLQAASDDNHSDAAGRVIEAATGYEMTDEEVKDFLEGMRDGNHAQIGRAMESAFKRHAEQYAESWDKEGRK